MNGALFTIIWLAIIGLAFEAEHEAKLYEKIRKGEIEW